MTIMEHRRILPCENSRFFQRIKIIFSIPASELKHTMGKLGEELTDETVAGIVSGGDADRDGKLNYQEFLQIMDSDEVVVVLRK